MCFSCNPVSKTFRCHRYYGVTSLLCQLLLDSRHPKVLQWRSIWFSSLSFVLYKPNAKLHSNQRSLSHPIGENADSGTTLRHGQRWEGAASRESTLMARADSSSDNFLCCDHYQFQDLDKCKFFPVMLSRTIAPIPTTAYLHCNLNFIWRKWSASTGLPAYSDTIGKRKSVTVSECHSNQPFLI